MELSNCGVCGSCVQSDFLNYTPFQRASKGLLCEQIIIVDKTPQKRMATKYEKLQAILTNADYIQQKQGTVSPYRKRSSLS